MIWDFYPIDGKGETKAYFKAKIGKARTAFTHLGKVWSATRISKKTKLRLFNSNSKSVLLYGCKSKSLSIYVSGPFYE